MNACFFCGSVHRCCTPWQHEGLLSRGCEVKKFISQAGKIQSSTLWAVTGWNTPGTSLLISVRDRRERLRCGLKPSLGATETGLKPKRGKKELRKPPVFRCSAVAAYGAAQNLPWSSPARRARAAYHREDCNLTASGGHVARDRTTPVPPTEICRRFLKQWSGNGFDTLTTRHRGSPAAERLELGNTGRSVA